MKIRRRNEKSYRCVTLYNHYGSNFSGSRNHSNGSTDACGDKGKAEKGVRRTDGISPGPVIEKTYGASGYAVT